MHKKSSLLGECRLGGLHSQKKKLLSKQVKIYCFEGFPNTLVLLNILRTKYNTSYLFLTNLLLLSFYGKDLLKKLNLLTGLSSCSASFKFIYHMKVTVDT